MITAIDLLWAVVGLLLTIGGTFLEASVTNPLSFWSSETTSILSLGVNSQVGAVLLIACLGGKNAATLSQIAYLTIGLTIIPIFSQGGGIGYLQEPSFGYLLGFIPAAWITGNIAFKASLKLELLAFSCLSGLLTIHLCGLSYLVIADAWKILGASPLNLFDMILKYSFYPLPGQLAVVCAVTVLAYIMRIFMFY